MDEYCCSDIKEAINYHEWIHVEDGQYTITANDDTIYLNNCPFCGAKL